MQAGGVVARPFNGLRGRPTIVCRPALSLSGKSRSSKQQLGLGYYWFHRNRKAAVKAIIEDVEENVKTKEAAKSKDLSMAEDEDDEFDNFDDLDEDLDLDADLEDDLDMDLGLEENDLGVGLKAMKELPKTQPAEAKKQEKKAEKKDSKDIQKTIKVDATQQPDDSLKLENIGLSPVTVKALAKKNIFALFPIQKEVFQPAMDGKDMICRAKTGSGKTLAFALPIVESLMKEKDVKAQTRGRTPRCLVLTPTRELAKQVEEEFHSAAPQLEMGVFYGGTSIMNQQRLLRKGTDAVVGTPGRLIDLIERGDLRLNNLRHLVLDEADMMLDMGFQEDVERIAAECPVGDRQTLLFSATLPSWVQKIANKYQKSPILVDLVGEKNTGKIADTIKPLAIQIDWKYKRNLLVDLLSVYGSEGKSIVFTSTKREADEVAAGIGQAISCEALHGDISQAQREKTLQKFRDGKFMALIATDVASRGLDIPNVDLVLHYDVPQNPESYLHRSGRTGRAGKTGTTIAMFAPRDKDHFYKIMRDTKTKVEIIGPPLPQDTMKAAALNVYKKMANVNTDVSQFFLPAASQMLQKGDPNKVLASALAALSGFREVPQPKSILSFEEGLVTLIALDPQNKLGSPNVLLRFMREAAGQQVADSIGRIQVIDDRSNNVQGIAFDIPVDIVEETMKSAKAPGGRWNGITLEQLRVLPVDFSQQDRGRMGRRGDHRQGGRDSYRREGSWSGRNQRGSGGNQRGSGGNQRGSGGYFDRDDRGRRDYRDNRGGRGGRGGRQNDFDDFGGGRRGGRRNSNFDDDFGFGGMSDRKGGRGRSNFDDFDDFGGDFGGGRSRGRGENRGGGRGGRGGNRGGGKGGRRGGDDFDFEDQFDMMGF